MLCRVISFDLAFEHFENDFIWLAGDESISVCVTVAISNFKSTANE